MNPNNLAKNLYSIRAVLIPALIGLWSVPSAFSTVIFQDNFNSYTDDASLTAVWTRASGTDTSILLSPDPANASNQTIQQTTEAGRLRFEIDGGITPTAQEPTIIYSFDLYDETGNTSGRLYGELRNSSAAVGLLAAGIYNAATSGTYDATKYSARTIDAANASMWISLDAARSAGWHNFRFEITGDHADLYVDNVLEPAFGALSTVSADYNWVNIGSALPGSSPGWYDNVNVSIVPEPSTVTLGLLGLSALCVRTWYRRR